MQRVPFNTLYAELLRILERTGFTRDRAALCARLFTEATCDGVASHGLNRFPRFMTMIERGVIDIRAEPERVGGSGAFERWHGHNGPGNINAHRCMERAIELARGHGLGCVALRNTNHWMRGGSYGWQAAEAGMIGICWTNTNQNLPPWGSREPRIGNNPIVLAVPRRSGPVVLDMAMSQFSYGALSAYRSRGERLPVPGGFDAEGRLSDDPAAIEDAQRPLPIGYWKGSGLSILLDLIVASLAAGTATHLISSDPLEECDLCQMFIAFDVATLTDPAETERLLDAVVAHLKASEPVTPGRPVRYPGESTLARRKENRERGIPVDPDVWHRVRAM